MSANNWALCPQCLRTNDVNWEKYQEKVRDSYGKIPPDEYLKMVNKTKPIMDETLQEDYTIQTSSDGEFYVSYSCRCNECGFSYNFKHEEQLVIVVNNEKPKRKTS